MTCTEKIRDLLTEVEIVDFGSLDNVRTQIWLHTLFYSEIHQIALRKAFHIDFKLNSVFSLSNITCDFSFLQVTKHKHHGFCIWHLCECVNNTTEGSDWDSRVSGTKTNPVSSLFKAATPSFSVVFVAFISGSKHPDAWAFLSGNNYGHPCLFPPPFHFMKLQSMCHCVCSEGPDRHFGGLGHCLHRCCSRPRITLLCVVKR